VLVVINGSPRDVAGDATVADVLALLGAPERGIAVAVDDAVRPRARWAEPLADGARVEVLTAVQGG
jgi:sulfur carrier protein